MRFRSIRLKKYTEFCHPEEAAAIADEGLLHLLRSHPPGRFAEFTVSEMKRILHFFQDDNEGHSME